jgi:hypothetical protein
MYYLFTSNLFTNKLKAQYNNINNPQISVSNFVIYLFLLLWSPSGLQHEGHSGDLKNRQLF